MTPPVLDSVERSLNNFKPRNQREFVALQIAARFKDEENLARYVAAAGRATKKLLLSAARTAERQEAESGQPAAANFFRLLEEPAAQEAA